MNSIGDFAASLIDQEVNSIQEGKSLPPNREVNQPKAAPAGKDISNIVVPDEMMSQILGEGFHPQETPTVDSIPEIVWTDPAEEEAAPVAPSMISESTAQQLVPLLEEVRNLLLEMTAATTSSGQIGTNFAGPSKQKDDMRSIEKALGYITSKPSKGQSKTTVLKNALKDKVRRSK
jgi:hypothetical protein